MDFIQVKGNSMEHIIGFLSKALALTLVFLAPIKSIMLAVGFLILVDFVTGIWAAKIKKEPITRFKMRRTIAKCLAYQMAVAVAFVIEQYLVPDVPVVKVVAALVGVTEGKSFFENLHVITGVDFWSQLLSRLQGQNSDKNNNSDKK